MKIATVLNSHSPDLAADTIESILAYVGKDVLLVVDGCAWSKFEAVDFPVQKVSGFRHGKNKAPYRNVALGLQLAWEQFPDCDWICYCESDVIFASQRFQVNLQMASDQGIWMLGNDGHVDDKTMPLVESLVGGKFRSIYYLLGCCQFFSRKFMQKLTDIKFFDRFLFLTNDFPPGYFPSYSGYDISEHMYPTLCRHFGGAVGVWATWDQEQWHGAYHYFPMRWKPELDPATDPYQDASILHPLKEMLNPIRVFHKERRKCLPP